MYRRPPSSTRTYPLFPYPTLFRYVGRAWLCGDCGVTTAPLPSRRDEAWRYSDIDAVAAAWPLPAPESIIVPAGGDFKRAIVQDEGAIRRIEMSLGKGAVAALHILNVGGAFGRIELAVTLHEGADFTLGAAQIGGGTQNLEIIKIGRAHV